jgi:DNA-directed RNA polymerase II subunit RPB11
MSFEQRSPGLPCSIGHLPFASCSSVRRSRQLLLDPNVTFAGYRIPHPLDNKVELRIATDPNPKDRPYVSPRKALLNACTTLMLLTQRLKKDFEEQSKALEIGAGVGLNMGMDMSQGGNLGSMGQPGGYGGMDGDFGYGGMSMGATQGASAEDPYQY